MKLIVMEWMIGGDKGGIGDCSVIGFACSFFSKKLVFIIVIIIC
jgi:hypothetical protein